MISEEKFNAFGSSIFILFGASIYIAKPPVNILYGMLFISALIYSALFYRKALFSQNAWAWILLIPLAAGFITSFFSLAGPKSSLAFLLRYRFLFLTFPFAFFVRDRNTLIRLFVLMNIAALFDVGYCFITSAGSGSFFYNLHGIHKLGRNSDMLFCLCLFNAGILMGGHKLGFFRNRPGLGMVLVIQTIILLASVLLLGERGAWLGLFAGLVVFLFVYSRKLLLVIAILLPIVLFNLPKVPHERLIDRHSTQIRLKLLKLGGEFIVDKNLWIRGTGAHTTQGFIESYISQKPQAYQERYHFILNHFPDNFHSSYLQMAVEAGVLFPLLFLGAVLFVIFSLIRARPLMSPHDSLIVWTAISVTCGSLIAQMFHEELFRYGGLASAIILYSACFISTAYRTPELPAPVFGPIKKKGS